MKISKRLKMTADIMPKCEFLYDVGTDHAYLPVYLVKTGKAKKAVASDISRVSADKAYENVKEENLTDKIEIRCGDGLSPLQEREHPDAILITGMGGMLTIEILKAKPEAMKNARYLILQPQHNIDKVRKYILENGFNIIAEDFTVDKGKAYFTLLCEKGTAEYYAPADLFLGRFLPKGRNPLFNDYLGRQIQKYEEKISTAYAKNKAADVSKLKERLNIMKEVYEKCQNASK